MTCLKKFGDEHTPLVTASARQKDFHCRSSHEAVLRPSIKPAAELRKNAHAD
jgi:hypothetical protein